MIVIVDPKTVTAVLATGITTTQPSLVAAYADVSDTSVLEGGNEIACNGTTPVVIVASPGAGPRRVVKSVYFTNLDTVAHTVTLLQNSVVVGRQTVVAGGCLDLLNPSMSFPFIVAGQNIDNAFSVAQTFAANITSAGSILSTSATSGIGYGVGAGGTVTQTTSKSTAVTLNKRCGTITMDAENLGSNTFVNFTLNNSTVASTDVIVCHIKSGATLGKYHVTIDSVSAGSCVIQLHNDTPGPLAEAVVLSFAVLSAVAS